ncbi:calcium-binding protein [Sphingomonas sp. Sphisp140]|uniref:calcium-binding protein n=1 Tax=unclassified Sphingomonas TaxID=196159 RepID=UPI0039B0E0C0
MTTVYIEAGTPGVDDSARIMAALADPDVTTVVLGPGTFYAASSIIVPSDKTLTGTSTDSTLIQALPEFARDEGSFGVVASATGAENVTVSNLSIDAAKLLIDGARLNACYMDQATGFTVENVNTYNATGYGQFAQGDLGAYQAGGEAVYASGSYTNCWSYNSNVAFEQMFCDGITLTNCNARDGDGDINSEYSFHPLSGSKNITYIDCTSISAVSGGFGLITSVAGLENISIIDCTVQTGTSAAITSAGFNPVTGLVIEGSSFVSTANAAARLGGVSGTIDGSYFEGAVIGAEFGYSSDGTPCVLLITNTDALGIVDPLSPVGSYGINVFGDGISWEGGKIEAWGALGLMFPISGLPLLGADTELVANGLYGFLGSDAPGDMILGTGVDDRLVGTDGNDWLAGFFGNDTLIGGAGQDLLEGGHGNDTYYVDAGDVVVEAAGDGFDTIYTSGNFTLDPDAEIEVLGTSDWRLTDPLRLTGNAFNNKLVGNSGDNQLYGGAGNDSLVGMDGNDILDGGAGYDLMQGGTGDDSYYVDDARDVVREAADEGFDTVYASSSFSLEAGSSVEVIGTTDWRLTDPLRLAGNEFNNRVVGNNGDNQIYGGAGDDTLLGLGGNDILDGGAGQDLMQGGTGDDTYYVNKGDKIVELAGEGLDAAYASESYALEAGVSIEVLGTADPNALTAIDLTGNELNNKLIGNAGANALDGGAGSDTLRGMGGADTFVFSTALGPTNIDLLPDFVSGEDHIALDSAIFTALGKGALSEGAFVTGRVATDADDRILYDAATGALYYDADGNGSGAAVQFATLTPGLHLAHTDFFVV